MIATFAIFFGLLQIHAFGFIPQSKMKTSQYHAYTSHHQIVYKTRIRNSNIQLASISNSDDHNDNDTSSASSLDMSSLRMRIQKQDNQYTSLLLEQSKYTDDERIIPESVYIILFLPDTPKQHVHTIEYPVGSGENMILAFESSSDCIQFSRMLQQDLDFAEPSVSIECCLLSYIGRYRCMLVWRNILKRVDRRSFHTLIGILICSHLCINYILF